MKSSLFSVLAATILFVSTAASAAPVANPRRPSPIERSRYEALQRQQEQQRRQAAEQRARYEAAQRRAAQQHRPGHGDSGHGRR